MQRAAGHNLDPVVLRQLEHHVIVDEVERSVKRVDRHVRRPIQLDLWCNARICLIMRTKMKPTSEMGMVPTQGSGFQVALWCWCPARVLIVPNSSTIRMLFPSAMYTLPSGPIAIPENSFQL